MTFLHLRHPLVISIFFLLISFFLVGLWKNVVLTKAAVSISLGPLADAYVYNSSTNAKKNFGTATTLQTDGSPVKISYLKFDLESLTGKTVLTAKLRLKVKDSSASTQTVKSVADSGWGETTITYNNRPALGSQITTISKAQAGTWYEVDITSAVSANAGQLMSLGIDSTGSDGVDFYSREAAEKPVLIVEYNDPTVPTDTPTPTQDPGVLTDTPTPTPTTPPVSGTDPVIATAGDIACESLTSTSTTCQQQQTSDLVIGINPDAVFALGDLQYSSGTYSNFLNYYDKSWGRFKDKTYPAIGNHEGTGTGYYDYFNGVGVQTGVAGTRDKGWYSFNLGSWHIVSLNTNCVADSNKVSCQEGSEQIEWLKADLAANPSTCTLAFMHQPYYSSGTRQYPELKTLWQTLYDYGADVVLAGHTHFYQRFYPQDANANRDDARGIAEIVVGTGGKDFPNLGNTTYQNMAIRDAKSFGVLKMVLRPASYDFSFLPAPGFTFTDSGTGQCH